MAALAVLLAAACSDGGAGEGGVDQPVDSAATGDTGATGETGGDTGGDDTGGDKTGEDDGYVGGGQPDGGGSGGGDASGDQTGQTGGAPDAGPDDAGGDDPVCGGFGAGCDDHDSCCSGWCVPSADGFVCTKTCDSPCPEGFECLLLQTDGADAAFLCLDVTASLCQPCQEGGCNAGNPTAPNLCLSYGADGNFCGLNCGPDGHVCPQGYTCEQIEGATEATELQCVRDVAASGPCTCNPWAIELGSETTCEVVNDEGACAGSRMCDVDGLTACDGPQASAELCNGADDDCDGLVDEEVNGGPCVVPSDYGECPGTTSCVDSAEICLGAPAVQEVCNGLDDDCDGETDEEGGEACAPYLCGDDGCATTCDGQDACVSAAFCDVDDANGNGAFDECLPKSGDGVACTDGNDFECESGRCANGYCCSAPEGDCCGSDLDCGHLAVAPTCTESAVGGCAGERVDGACSADFVCGTTTVSDASACAGSVCEASSCGDGGWTAPRTCDAAGMCGAAAAASSCDDGNVCTADSCDDLAGCGSTPFDGPSETPCYSFEPSWTKGIGACKEGLVGCSDGSPTGCQDQVGPTTESCNGQDDNCDGTTDEGVDSQCAPYQCLGEDGCATSCTTHDQCAAGYFCDLHDLDGDANTHECLPMQDAGEPCSHEEQCSPGYCNNGFCCGSPTGDCCGSSFHCSHLSVTAACTNVATCTGKRTDGVCGGDHVCSAQTVVDPTPCASQICQAPYCQGTTKKGGASCNGAGQCAALLPDQNCVGTNDLACAYGCSSGTCTANMTNDAVATACYLFEAFGVSLPLGFICDC